MKKFIFLMLVIGVGSSNFAMAQTNNSASGAASNASVNNASVAVANGGASSSAPGIATLNLGVSPSTVITSTGSDLGKAIPSTIAPAMTTSLTETCMGSATGSLAVSGFGGTFGKTYRDDDCVARLNAREMRALGFNDVSMEILCSRPTVYTAMARVAQRSRTLSKCSGMNPGSKEYDAMALSSELTAAGGYDPVDDVYVDGKIVGKWDYERDGTTENEDFMFD